MNRPKATLNCLTPVALCPTGCAASTSAPSIPSASAAASTSAGNGSARQALGANCAASKVQIVELTVDPGRDTPARLAANAKLADADWQFVTEPPAELRRPADFFGYYFQQERPS